MKREYIIIKFSVLNSNSKFEDIIANKDLTVDEFLFELNPIINILDDLGVVVTEKGLNYFLRSDIEDINNLEAIKLQTNYLLNKLWEIYFFINLI